MGIWPFLQKCIGLRPLLERGASCHVHRLGILQVGFHLAGSLTAHRRVVLGHPFDGKWAYTFKGLDHEDWRYTRYRETQSPFIFHIINFFGLNMMPTVLVFAAMLPGFGLFESTEAANLLTWLGFAICISAATLQLVSDTQIHRFREAHPGQYCDVGFWKHGRHPNYLGEISMWWGVWTMYASVYGLDCLILAPVAMTALFLFISIPMMERRQLQNKPGYAEYKKLFLHELHTTVLGATFC